MTKHKRNKTCMGTPEPRTFRNVIEEIGEPCANQQMHETFKHAFELADAVGDLHILTLDLSLPKKLWELLAKLDNLEIEMMVDLNRCWDVDEETVEQIYYEEHK